MTEQDGIQNGKLPASHIPIMSVDRASGWGWIGLRRTAAGWCRRLYWLQKSADQHFCLAEQALALNYQMEVAVARDDDQARTWYTKATDHPTTDFCQNMAEESLKALDRRSSKPR